MVDGEISVYVTVVPIVGSEKNSSLMYAPSTLLYRNSNHELTGIDGGRTLNNQAITMSGRAGPRYNNLKQSLDMQTVIIARAACSLASVLYRFPAAEAGTRSAGDTPHAIFNLAARTHVADAQPAADK